MSSSPGLAAILALVSILGLLLNGYVLLVVMLARQVGTVHTANKLLLLHLGVVEFALCLVFLVFSAPALLLRGGGSTSSGGGSSSGGTGGVVGWQTSSVGPFCQLHGFLFTLLHPVALWTVCGLDCDRYYAISAPLHYGALVNPRRVAYGLGAAWALGVALCLPPLLRLAAPYRYDYTLGGCAPDFSHAQGRDAWYAAVYTALALFVPALLILGCNIKVLMIARYHRHRIASAIFEVTLSAQVTITHQRNPFGHSPGPVSPSGALAAAAAAAAGRFKGRRNAVTSVLQLLGIFLVLHVPYHVCVVWQTAAALTQGARVSPHLTGLAAALLACSPPVNGLMYGVRSRLLRKTFQNYWRKQMSKSEMNHEIQARTPSACGSRRPSLTPLGLLSRPILGSSGAFLQRRLSEAFLDARGSSPSGANKPRIHRTSSGSQWRPASLTGLDGSHSSPSNLTVLQRARQQVFAHSFNTLQVPSNSTEDRSANGSSLDDTISLTTMTGISPPPRISRPGHVFLNKMLSAATTNCRPTPFRQSSPRILITRAYSQESSSSAGIKNPIGLSSGNSISNPSLSDKPKWRPALYHSNLEGDDNDTVASASSMEEDDVRSDKSYGRLRLSIDTKPPTSQSSTVTLSWPPTSRQTRLAARSLVDLTLTPEFVL